jgi:hypothetical protein
MMATASKRRHRREDTMEDKNAHAPKTAASGDAGVGEIRKPAAEPATPVLNTRQAVSEDLEAAAITRAIKSSQGADDREQAVRDAVKPLASLGSSGDGKQRAANLRRAAAEAERAAKPGHAR